MGESISVNTSQQKKRPYLDVSADCKEPKQEPLWKPEGKSYNPGIVGLHEEIIDFVNYVCPSLEEHWVREIVISKVKNVIYSLWRECRVDVFGSFSTGLYLPTSDIDVVIFGKWLHLPLGTLERALQESNFATDIKVLSKATVPIVKFTDSDTGLRVDISFNMVNSVRAVKFVQTYLSIYPCLRYLVFTLKQFLLLRELNEVWTGGISSYALILMCICFLQQYAGENETAKTRNLGTLLLEFFEFYGIRFNYRITGIKISEHSSFFPIETSQRAMAYNDYDHNLYIEDPLCPGNNVARRSYSSYIVLRAFKHAYLTLSASLRADTDIVGTALSSILNIPPSTLESRKCVNAYASLMCQLMPSLITPVMLLRKSTVSPLHAQPQLKTTQPPDCSDEQINGAACTTKEPIIVSARGLGTRPPTFLRAPNGSDMLLLSQSLPSYGYLSNSIFYDHLAFPISNAPNVTSTVPKSVFVVLSHSALPAQGQLLYPPCCPVHSVTSSGDGESTAVSQTAPSGGFDCDRILAESGLDETHDNDNISLSGDKEARRDVKTPNRHYKSGRSVSASNTCSNRANKLAPLRLFSSEQNVSGAPENQESNFSYPASSSIPSTSSSTTSSTKSKETETREQMEAYLPQTPPPSQARGSKSSRRRRRPLRKSVGVSSSAEDPSLASSASGTQASPRPHGYYFSSNDETEECGNSCQSVHQMKRRCSQLHSIGNCHGGKLGATRERTKDWSSFKPSNRMDSVTPAQNIIASEKYDSLLVAAPNSLLMPKNVKKQQHSPKSKIMSLKRHAVMGSRSEKE